MCSQRQASGEPKLDDLAIFWLATPSTNMPAMIGAGSGSLDAAAAYTAFGWSTAFDSLANTLSYAVLGLQKAEECDKQNRAKRDKLGLPRLTRSITTNNATLVCAYGQRGFEGAAGASGDSGGGLIRPGTRATRGAASVVAVLSASVATEDVPTIFTKVEPYRATIERLLGGFAPGPPRLRRA
jgi:secreted trypsin-like serine protease